MDEQRIAPFSPAEVATLNEFQKSGVWQTFTCPDESCARVLVATEAGWVCPGCSYTQDSAYSWMADGSWRDNQEILKREG
jgi:hypothetical protein